MPVFRVLRVLAVPVALIGIAACRGESFVSTTDPTGAGMEKPLGADTVTIGDLDVWLHRVGNEQPAMESGPRNPFRFGLEPAPVPAQTSGGTPTGGPEQPSPTVRQMPQRSTGRPVERLKFVGLVDAPSSAGLIAVLTDGDVVFHGRVGETVDGQYRIVRIGLTSVEIERLPAGGRQVLHLARP